jgi:hypothetical protein
MTGSANLRNGFTVMRNVGTAREPSVVEPHVSISASFSFEHLHGSDEWAVRQLAQRRQAWWTKLVAQQHYFR